MATTTTESLKDLQVFASAQATAFATPEYIPAPAEAILARELEITTDAGYVEAEPDHTGGMAAGGSVVSSRSCSVRMLLTERSAGAAGTAPDHGELLECAGFSAGATSGDTTVAASPASTTTKIYVASASAYTAYTDCVAIERTTSDGATRYDARLVTAVNTTGDNYIEVSPPLPAVPTDGDAVTGGVTYSPLTASEDTAATVWGYLTHGLRKAWGWFIDSLTWSIDDGPPTLELSGPARGATQAAPTTMDGGIDASVTTATVDDGRRIGLWSELTIEAEGVNSAEAIRVTHKTAAGVLTIVRDADGSGADAHGDAATVVPYQPSSRTLTDGLPISPSKCRLWLGLASDSCTDVRLGSMDLSISGGITPTEQAAGDYYQVQGYTLSMDREVEMSGSGTFRQADYDYWQRSGADAEADISPEEIAGALQMGDQSGEIVTVIMPRLVAQEVEAGASGDGEVASTFTLSARGTRSGSDSQIYLFYV